MFRCVTLFLLVAACNKSETPASSEDKGRQAYLNNCTACHAADPSKDGAIGPAVKGSSRELIEARVLRATYPEGYKPKRETKNMLALPHLSSSIDDLAAFLK